VLANSIGATLGLARCAWVQNYRLEFLMLQAPADILFKRAGLKNRRQEDNNDDADDVENVHVVLRLRHTRFQHESTAL